MTTLALQPDPSAGQDAFISASTPTTNKGSDIQLISGYYQSVIGPARPVIQFDISSVPAGATVDSATVGLYLSSVANAGTQYLDFYRVLRAWVESQVTWDIAATGADWGTAGCADTVSDREPVVIGTATLATANAWYSASLQPSLVQEWVSGAITNNGLIGILRGETNTWLRYFRSSDYTDDTSLRPKLTIEYTEGSGGGITHRVIGSGIINSRAIVRGAA